MKNIIPLLELIKDGHFVSGVSLAEKLNVTRATISSWMKDLEQYGLTIYKIPGKGYKLSDPIMFQSRDEIFAHLPADIISKLKVVDIVAEVDSTNKNALAAEYETGDWRLYSTEFQHGGRGRRGKAWVSPFGANLLFSLGHKTAFKADVLYLASIICGLAVVEVVQELTTERVMLKWPNDIYVKDCKLAGILCELQGSIQDEPLVVIGVGINMYHRPEQTDIPAIRIADIDTTQISREKLLAKLVANIISKIERAHINGAADALSNWSKVDYLLGKEIVVSMGPKNFTGISHGIDSTGQLILKLTDGTVKLFNGGEVSVRW